MNIIVKNIATNYLSTGKGDTVLILHGWGDNLQSFNSVINLLSSKYNVVAVDLPGFGGTELPKQAWHVKDYAIFVKNFCEKINIKPKYILGHSMGGRILIKIISQKLLKPKKIILLSSAGIRESEKNVNKIIKSLSRPVKVLIDSPMLGKYGEKIKRKLYSKVGSEDYINSGDLKQTFINIVDEDLINDAKKIDLPTLLIYGEYDDQTPPSYGVKFNNAIKGSELKIISAGGHFIQSEDPNGLCEIIEDFLK